MKALRAIFILILFGALTSYAVDQKPKEIIISQEKGIEFTAETNIFITVKGIGPLLDGKVAVSKDVVSGEFSVQMNKFETGDDARDQHLIETFDAKKHPLSTLKIKDLKYNEGDFPFKGNLTIKDITKPVDGKCSKAGKNIKCDFIVKQSDYGLKIPSTIATKLGAKVDDKIAVKVHFSI